MGVEVGCNEDTRPDVIAAAIAADQGEAERKDSPQQGRWSPTNLLPLFFHSHVASYVTYWLLAIEPTLGTV